MLKRDIIRLYSLLLKYNHKDDAIKLVTNHYYYRVKDVMTKSVFQSKVTELIEISLKEKI